MKIVTVLGARPQFIKAAPVTTALRRAGHRELLLHTGQHYDYRMSQVFFEELGIPAPEVNLEVGSAPHGRQTGRMLEGIEQVLLNDRPDWVLVYGDTNSTLAGALAAAKLGIPLAHVESGMRSYNRAMPEEHNRVLTDHCSNLLFCPTETALANLAREGITQGVHWVGDTMYDVMLQFAQLARDRSQILQQLNLSPRQYLLATVHRAYNTDNHENLESILSALTALDETVVFTVHPRTRVQLTQLGWDMTADGNVRFIEPVGFLDMLVLEQHARLILTDSGGMQKEAYFAGVPCITLRPETEWGETVEGGWNVLTGADSEKIAAAVRKADWPAGKPAARFGKGDAALRIEAILGEPEYQYTVE